MNKPRWLELSDQLLWPTVQFTMELLCNRNGKDLTLNAVPQCAIIHLGHCLDTSMRANKEGRHSTAICLVRQCVESVTIVEVGLRTVSQGDPMLTAWQSGKKSHGELRSQLEREAWPAYGEGLWGESWSNFFGQLARAVQPYAHYTPELLGWQFAIPAGSGMVGNKFLAAIGPKTYDPLKASRITLLHTLVGWTIGRLLAGNNHLPPDMQVAISELGESLAASEFLCGGKATWPQELWPHMFFKLGVADTT